MHRTQETRRVISDMLRTGSRRILLHELNRLEVQELTTYTISNAENPNLLAEDVYRLTHGLPLFVAEILEQLKRSNPSDVPLSETIQEAIDLKLGLLNTACQSVLEEAAQIGEQFSYHLLVSLPAQRKLQLQHWRKPNNWDSFGKLNISRVRFNSGMR